VAAFTYQATIRFSHTDPSGTVYFPRFFEFIQAAAEDWFTIGLGINFARMIGGGAGQPTVHTECDFSKPCYLGDKLEVTVYLEKIGSKSFALLFLGAVGGEARLQARSVQVMVNLETGKSFPIPDDMRAAMESYKAANPAPILV